MEETRSEKEEVGSKEQGGSEKRGVRWKREERRKLGLGREGRGEQLLSRTKEVRDERKKKRTENA